jgi:hypothetical protein
MRNSNGKNGQKWAIDLPSGKHSNRQFAIENDDLS